MRIVIPILLVIITASIVAKETRALSRCVQHVHQASVAQDEAYQAHVSHLDRNVRLLVGAGY